MSHRLTAPPEIHPAASPTVQGATMEPSASRPQYWQAPTMSTIHRCMRFDKRAIRQRHPPAPASVASVRGRIACRVVVLWIEIALHSTFARTMTDHSIQRSVLILMRHLKTTLSNLFPQFTQYPPLNTRSVAGNAGSSSWLLVRCSWLLRGLEGTRGECRCPLIVVDLAKDPRGAANSG